MVQLRLSVENFAYRLEQDLLFARYTDGPNPLEISRIHLVENNLPSLLAIDCG